MGTFFPVIYDLFMKPLENTTFKKIRKNLLNKAEGRVLEIGSGTGINFPYYRNVNQVDAIEPNLSMRTKSLKRAEHATIPIQTYLVKAEKLPFPDNTFDTVVGTLVFCTIPDPVLALHEIERVSKPDAKILLFEHVKLNHKKLGKLQDILTPYWKKVCDGCHLNRDTLNFIKKSQLSIDNVEHFYKGLFITIECINKKNEI